MTIFLINVPQIKNSFDCLPQDHFKGFYVGSSHSIIDLPTSEEGLIVHQNSSTGLKGEIRLATDTATTATLSMRQ
jgi:hypothetical protein